MTATLTVLTLAGGVIGAGVAVAASGLVPRRPALAVVIDALSGPAPALLTAGRRFELAVAAPLQRLGLPRARTRPDLAIMERDQAQYLAGLFVAALAALLGVGMLPLLVGIRGQVPLWAGLIAAAVAVRVVTDRLHTAAQDRRVEMRATIAAMLDLVGASLAGGAGIEQAVDETLDELTGWSAARIRAELASAARTRGPGRLHSWTVLRELGRTIGVDEVSEVATGIEQATAGAPVAETMANIAAIMRERSVAALEQAGRARAAKMAIPLVLFGLGYLVVLLYGAAVAIGQGFNH